MSDAVLILFGVFVVGDTVAQTSFDGLLRAFAVLFLVGYAGLRFRSSLIGTQGLSMETGSDPSSIGRTIALTLGFTWLNPHVYLDTVLLIGGGAVGLDGTDRILFAGGAMAAPSHSSSPRVRARSFSSFVTQPVAWRVIDFGIGVTMLLIAIGVWTRCPRVAHAIQQGLERSLYLEAEWTVVDRQVSIIEHLIEHGGSHPEPHVHVLGLIEQPFVDGLLDGVPDVPWDLAVLELPENRRYLLDLGLYVGHLVHLRPAQGSPWLNLIPLVNRRSMMPRACSCWHARGSPPPR